MTIRITLHDDEIDLIETLFEKWEALLSNDKNAGTAGPSYLAAAKFTRKRISALLGKIKEAKTKEKR